MNSHRSTTPVIAISETPRDGRDAERFARGVRTYADTLRVSGLVIVSTHWNRSNDSPSVIIEVDEQNEPSTDSFALAEHAAALLQKAGLSTEFGREWPRSNGFWNSLLAAHEGAAFPMIHVSVPARFGSDLMVLAARALEPLRRETVLLVGLSSSFAEGFRYDAGRADRPSFGLAPSNIVVGAPF